MVILTRWIEKRLHLKQTRECLTAFPNTLVLVKHTPLRRFTVFGKVVKHDLPCFNYNTEMAISLANIINRWSPIDPRTNQSEDCNTTLKKNESW